MRFKEEVDGRRLDNVAFISGFNRPVFFFAFWGVGKPAQFDPLPSKKNSEKLNKFTFIGIDTYLSLLLLLSPLCTKPMTCQS